MARGKRSLLSYSVQEVLDNWTTPNGTCLEWTRCFNTDGYPRATINYDNNVKVHRMIWERVNEASAAGLVVRHTCDNPKCINPAHLLIGTVADNVADMDQRGRRGFRRGRSAV